MSRGPAKVILEIVDKKTYKMDQIIESSGIWAVYYKDQPFNLKNTHYLDSDAIPKYKRTVFNNPGHARNLCRKLNIQFKTDSFSVVYLTHGDKVYQE